VHRHLGAYLKGRKVIELGGKGVTWSKKRRGTVGSYDRATWTYQPCGKSPCATRLEKNWEGGKAKSRGYGGLGDRRAQQPTNQNRVKNLGQVAIFKERGKLGRLKGKEIEGKGRAEVLGVNSRNNARRQELDAALSEKRDENRD